MDPNPELNEVMEQNTHTPSNLPELNIKKEISDEDIISKHDDLDDYGFEPFHENIFRTLSANFDNLKNIDQVNEAYEKLENCFMKNNILTKNGTSKIVLKGPASSAVFLKYKDIDDAFMDMVISESNVKHKNINSSPMKIDLKPFEDSFFSIDLNDSPLSDSEECQSKINESDAEGIEESESHIEGSQTENDISDGEVSTVDDIDYILEGNDAPLDDSEGLDVSPSLTSDVKGEVPGDVKGLTHTLSHLESKDNEGLDNVCNVENSCDTSLKETVRDIRIVVEKLPSDISEEADEDSDEEGQDEYPIQVSSNKLISNPSRQVARKKTGGMVLNNMVDDDNAEHKIIQQLSSKDGDFVPNVFDKMTRAGKRDLERVLKESTANLVKQKTTKIISDKYKELHPDDENLNDSSSEDEDKQREILKTAEIVTNTIIEFLTKTKSKKLEKLGKDITDEIANKINNFKFGLEASSSVEEPTSTEIFERPNEITSPTEVVSEKNVEDKQAKSVDKIEETIPRRITREVSRLNAQKMNEKNKKKSPVRPAGVRKTLAEQFEEIERVERDIINCELSTSLIDEELDEPRRPETRQSKQKQHEIAKGVPENVPSIEVKRPTPSKRRSGSKSKKKASGKNSNKLKNMSASENIEPLPQEHLIDGQFLIDSELNNDSILCVSESDLNKLTKVNDTSSFADRTILKASADSTTSDNAITNNEINVNDVTTSSVDDHLLLTQSGIDNIMDKPILITEINSVGKNVCDNVNTQTDEECQSKCLKEANLKETSVDMNERNDSGVIPAKDSKNTVIPIENKENIHIQEISKVGKDRHDDEAMKLCPEKLPEVEKGEIYGFDKPSISRGIVDTTSDSLVKPDSKVENKIAKKSEPLPVDDINEPFKVLNDMITDIEKNMLEKETESKDLSDKDYSSSTGVGLDHSKNCTPENDVKESSSLTLEVSADSTSLLSYTMDDSLRLMIDESAPEDDLTEKDMDLDTSLESNENNDLIKENNEKNHLKLQTVIEKDLGKTWESENNKADDKVDKQAVPKFSVLRPLTNEEKIAQLTKRDPRLVNDKKIVNVLMRDPRIRNKLPKVEAERQKPPEPQVLDSPMSPDPEPVARPVTSVTSKPLPTTGEIKEKNQSLHPATGEIKEKNQSLHPTTDEIKEKNQYLHPSTSEIKETNQSVHPTTAEINEKNQSLQETTKSEFLDLNFDQNRRKKPKKKVDEELIYKTPLSDLHETNNDRPTYDRSKKRRNAPPVKKGREVDEEVRPSLSRRNRAKEELNEDGASYNQRQENDMPERYYNRESYDERKFNPSSSEEGSRRTEGQYYGGKFEGRNFHHEERDFHPGPRDTFEQDAYVRRLRNEENLNASRDRNDFSENHIYSRREFYRRNKYAHDHDHFSNSSRLMETRNEEHYFSQQNNFTIPAETVFQVSAYPPVSLLPDPMYSQEEDFDQSFGNMDTDSFSPPSSDLCPPPPLIRSPSPEMLRRDNYCPSPPRIGRGGGSPANEREFEEYNRNFHRNYERDERSYRGGRSNFNRDTGNNRGYRGGNNYRRGKGRDYRRNEESPPRKRFASDYQRGHDDRGRWRRSPSWSPDRMRRWSRERSMSPPPHEPKPWDSPRTRTPSPPRWHDNYRERMPSHKHYQRYN